MANLFTLLEENDKYIKIKKETHELKIVVELSLVHKDLEVNTSLHFLDHMLSTLSWGACMSIGCVVIREDGVLPTP